MDRKLRNRTLLLLGVGSSGGVCADSGEWTAAGGKNIGDQAGAAKHHVLDQQQRKSGADLAVRRAGAVGYVRRKGLCVGRAERKERPVAAETGCEGCRGAAGRRQERSCCTRKTICGRRKRVGAPMTRRGYRATWRKHRRTAIVCSGSTIPWNGCWRKVQRPKTNWRRTNWCWRKRGRTWTSSRPRNRNSRARSDWTHLAGGTGGAAGSERCGGAGRQSAPRENHGADRLHVVFAAR